MQDLKNFKDVWHKFNIILTKSQKRWGIVVFILTIFGSLVEMLGVSIILPLVQVMIEPQKIREISIIDWICIKMHMETDEQLLLLVALGVILVYLIKNVYLGILSYIRVKYSAKVQRELSIRMLNSYMSRGYTFFRLTNSSKLMRGISGAVVGIYSVLFQFLKILSELLTITCICIYIIVTDWLMAVCVIGLAGVCLLLMLYVFRGIMRKAGKKFYDNMEKVNKYSFQMFGGIKEVLVLNRKDYFTSNYERAYANQQKGLVSQTVAMESPAYIIEGVCVIGLIAAVCIRVYGMDNPAAYIPQLASFAVAAFRILPSIGRISSSFNSCVFNMPAVTEMYDNIVEARQYEEKYAVNIIENNHTGITFNRELTLKDITWKYPDGDENVLNHVSINIKKGEAVAFIGPSGAGKSTLADIILGLFVPQEGRVMLDGKDITGDMELRSRIISFVPQSVYLIDDTIRRNIAFGIEDDKIDESAVWASLQQAQMKEFVESLPKGLDTYIGERGVRFSGGQGQRLAIARALYTNPSIMVLDEATSALDTETEAAVMDAINALQGHKTLIIVAHRINTIKKCDKIYEIKDGTAVLKEKEKIFG